MKKIIFGSALALVLSFFAGSASAHEGEVLESGANWGMMSGANWGVMGGYGWLGALMGTVWLLVGVAVLAWIIRSLVSKR